MSTVFLDTSYLVALVSPRDEWHDQAVALAESLTCDRLLTTDLVLAEFLNFFCKFCSGRGGGPDECDCLRDRAVGYVRTLQGAQQVEVVRLTPELFEETLNYYARHLDKTFSFVDCMSMVVCDNHGVTEVATADHHFTQAGFIQLLQTN